MKQLDVVHGIICSVPDHVLLGYFGWPSVAKLNDGSIAAVASGFRAAHVCACGKDVLFTSKDEGKTWDKGKVINDSMADDRDAGILQMNNGEVLLSWFSSDVRVYMKEEYALDYPTQPVLDALDDEDIKKYIGSFIRIRGTNLRWGKPIRVLASAPHGPIQLKNGDLFYLGTQYGRQNPDGSITYKMGDMRDGLVAVRSFDDGRSWKTLGRINTFPGKMYEPHAIELNDGRIMGMIRVHDPFSIYKTFSADGGETWSTPEFVTAGSPPHLIRHSSGVIVCAYGYRQPAYGQRVMFSCDEGKTWDCDWIIRDDGLNHDLGYPATAELSDGSMLSVYYQHQPGQNNASLMYSIWKMPAL